MARREVLEKAILKRVRTEMLGERKTKQEENDDGGEEKRKMRREENEDGMISLVSAGS